MNKVTYEQFFAALAGSNRLNILQHLEQNGAQNVSEIASALGQEQSAVSHNLKKLHSCECVHVEVRGKHRYYSLNDQTIVPLLKLADRHIESFCQSKCQHCSVK